MPSSTSTHYLPPKIQTYHCICSTLLLATTHILSTLPRRSTTSGGLDAAYILPLPSSPPTFSLPTEDEQENEKEQNQDLPTEGYTILLPSLQPTTHADGTPKPVIVRREDGFEKRILYRCARCRVVVGYELLSSPTSVLPSEKMDIDSGSGSGGEGKEYKGEIIYILPGGLMSSEVMLSAGKEGGGRKVTEESVDIKVAGLGVFE
ncbi:hypothetical protein G7Y89_g15514 [Cudoniella acicularis]|uniref:STEEP1 domain-containing protein n=1 Tax=Cudoniella acicularis TaxID=354080 RepID=A0A8H4QLW9_9HELO|nr:hypothetical protein G7Y89_g15514 [Cudoniella acicularis]